MVEFESGRHYYITNAKAGTVIDLNAMDNYTSASEGRVVLVHGR